MIASLALVSGSAGATGWLVHVESGAVLGASVHYGTNVFGGQGDTVDVGLFNTQCTDEDDVVDVGVANREGDASPECRNDPDDRQKRDHPCEPDQGGNVLIVHVDGQVLVLPVPAPPQIGPDTYHPHDPHCSDDGDTVDVGVLNHEGGAGPFWGPDCEFSQNGTQNTDEGDAEDGVDAGVGNRECNDRKDAVDVGVANCEWRDPDDGIDVGFANLEEVEDGSDTFDLSLFNTEVNDPVDGNGANVGPQFPLWQLFCFLSIDDPIPIDDPTIPP